VAHSALANSDLCNSDPFSGHIPALLRPLGVPAEHTAQANSDPSVQSRHMTLTTATPPGPGYIPPARVHAPAGQAQSSKSPKLRTQQATEGVRRGRYYDKAYVEARLKLYVQRTLERSCTARCLVHSAVLSNGLLGSNPTSIAPLRVHTPAAALAQQRTYLSHVRRRKFRVFFHELVDHFLRC
jgi:hypothetical protein